VYYSLWYNAPTMLPVGSLEAEAEHVELVEITNKPLLLHLVGVYIIYMNYTRSNKHQTDGASLILCH